MSMLPQPPPDAPAPPPSEAALLSRRKWKWLWIIGLASMAVVVAASPLFLGRSRCCHSPHVEAINNARQIGLALFEFETAYGGFPDASTIPVLQKETGTLLSLGTTTSNDFFRQLIGAEIAGGEGMFYAKTAGGGKPDNVFNTSRALEKRECGFTYFLGATTADNPRRAVAVAPMIPGTDRFDPKPFEGKAVVLMVDNSVKSLPIDKHGHIFIDGRNLMDPHHPIWDGHAPVIAWPDL